MLSTIMTLQMLAQSAGDRLAARLDREDGATAVEYGLMVALIAAVIVSIVYFLGQEIQSSFQTVCDEVIKVTGGTCS